MRNESTLLIIFVVALGLATKVTAQNYTDWDNGDPANHLWSSPRNWNPDGLPTMIGNSNNRTRIESGSGHGNYPVLDATIFTTDPNGAFADRLYVGHQQGDNSTAKLWVINGAKLTVGDDLNIAYDDNSHGICYVSGKSTVIDILDGVKVGRRGDGTLVMSGGTMNVSGIIEIPSQTNTQSLNIGHLQLDGGTINCSGLTMRPDSYSTGTMDVGGGELIISGDAKAAIEEFVNNGWITAYRGNGTLQLDYDITNPGKTTLTASHPLNPTPADGSTIAPGAVELSWTLPDPCVPGEPVPVDVYFTDDYDALSQFTNPAAIRVVNKQNVTSVVVQTQAKTQYYWAVDAYIGDPNDPILGPIFRFFTDNLSPQVDAGADVVTWLVDGVMTKNLDATVTDDETTTVQWTVISEPDDPNNPDAVIADPSAEDTSITLSAYGEYVLQLEASDGQYSGSDTVTINVYHDGCQAAQSLPDYVLLVGDLNGDCGVDELDLALLEENWLKNNSLTEP